MENPKLRVCPDHKEIGGVLLYVCCSEECQTFLCDFCLKGHTDHRIFSLAQLNYHRKESKDALHRYMNEFREKGESLFNTLAVEIGKIIESNRKSFLGYLNNVANNIHEFQGLYDEFERYPSLNNKMIKRYIEIRHLLNRNTFQYQMQFLQDQVHDFVETMNKKIANFRDHLEKDLATNFNDMEVKKSVCVKEGRGYNPRAMKLVEDSLIATGSKNGIVCLWDYEKLRECSRKNVDSEVFCLEYVKDHKLLFCGASQHIFVFKVSNKLLVKCRTLRVQSEVNNLLYLESNILVTTEKQYGVIMRNIRDLRAISKIRISEISSVSYIPSRKRLLLDSPRGLTYIHVKTRVPSHFVAIGDINLYSRSCHGLYYISNWQKFIVPVNSRRIVQLKSDLSLEKKIDTPVNYGFTNKPCTFVSNEDGSQTIVTTGGQGFILIEKDAVKFVALEKIRRSSAVTYVKEKRILIIAEFEEESIFIVKLKSMFDN